MRNLELKEVKEVNGGMSLGCGLAIASLAFSLASVGLSPATGGASLFVSQAAIAASAASIGASCSPGNDGQPQ
ncbi:hypothetical protein ABW636_06140 [Aquimarina sp. 2201CG1-2-11]|uniref:hypothetical protein n=1 Tax=Aquimarina discodermiae TaxID=3231043 RepID=UPI0034630660